MMHVTARSARRLARGARECALAQEQDYSYRILRDGQDCLGVYAAHDTSA